MKEAGLHGIYHVVHIYATPSDMPHITVLLNKSPITGQVNAYHDKNTLSIFGCGLHCDVKARPAFLLINIMTPYIPIVTDGKEPDLSVVAPKLDEGIKKALSRAQKFLSGAVAEKKKSQKEVVGECLQEAIAKASGNGEYRFSLRQLYYAVRPYVIRETGKVIPPENIMEESLERSLEAKLGRVIADEILEQNHYDAQVAAAVRQVKQRYHDSQTCGSHTSLKETVQAELAREPVNLWKDVVKGVSEGIIKNYRF